MTSETTDLSSSSYVPEDDQTIIATGEYVTPIWREGNRGVSKRVSFLQTQSTNAFYVSSEALNFTPTLNMKETRAAVYLRNRRISPLNSSDPVVTITFSCVSSWFDPRKRRLHELQKCASGRFDTPQYGQKISALSGSIMEIRLPLQRAMVQDSLFPHCWQKTAMGVIAIPQYGQKRG